MSLTFPIDATLKDGLPIQLVQADKRDMELLRRLYRDHRAVKVAGTSIFSSIGYSKAAGLI